MHDSACYKPILALHIINFSSCFSNYWWGEGGGAKRYVCPQYFHWRGDCPPPPPPGSTPLLAWSMSVLWWSLPVVRISEDQLPVVRHDVRHVGIEDQMVYHVHVAWNVKATKSVLNIHAAIRKIYISIRSISLPETELISYIILLLSILIYHHINKKKLLW